jgi:hypothetical protein
MRQPTVRKVNIYIYIYIYKLKTKLHGLSPRANYTDRATAACRRSDCQFLRIEVATWSALAVSCNPLLCLHCLREEWIPQTNERHNDHLGGVLYCNREVASPICIRNEAPLPVLTAAGSLIMLYPCECTFTVLQCYRMAMFNGTAPNIQRWAVMYCDMTATAGSHCGIAVR